MSLLKKLWALKLKRERMLTIWKLLRLLAVLKEFIIGISHEKKHCIVRSFCRGKRVENFRKWWILLYFHEKLTFKKRQVLNLIRSRGWTKGRQFDRPILLRGSQSNKKLTCLSGTRWSFVGLGVRHFPGHGESEIPGCQKNQYDLWIVRTLAWIH
jgi:hypothetical protein